MAESLVAFFLTKLSDLLLQQASKLEGAEEQLRHLQSELQWMRLVLKDRDADPNRGNTDERFQLFATQIRDIIFAAEDVVDEFVFKLSRHSRQRQRFAGIMAGCLCFATKSVILHDLDSQIRVINGKTKKISTDKSRPCGALEVGSWRKTGIIILFSHVKEDPMLKFHHALQGLSISGDCGCEMGMLLVFKCQELLRSDPYSCILPIPACVVSCDLSFYSLLLLCISIFLLTLEASLLFP